MAGAETGQVAGRSLAEPVSWVQVADLADLPPGSAREVRWGGRLYALFRLGDSVHCLAGLCPHQGGRLAESGRADVVVTCPRVGCLRWQFDVRTGACLQHGRIRLWSYDVRIEAGSVFFAASRSAASR